MPDLRPTVDIVRDYVGTGLMALAVVLGAVADEAQRMSDRVIGEKR